MPQTENIQALYKRARKEFTRQSTWWAIAGAFLLLIGIELRTALEHIPTARRGHWFLIGQAGSHFLIELAFAIIIAIVIGRIFEYATRSHLIDELDKKIDEVKADVFKAVLGYNIQPELLNKIIAIIKDIKITRSFYKVTYYIERAHYISSGQAVEFITMTADTDITMRNISGKDVDYPIRLILPNPFVEKMKEHVCVHSMMFEDRERKSKEADRKLIEDLQDNDKTEIIYDCGLEKISSGERANITARYVMAKETRRY